MDKKSSRWLRLLPVVFITYSLAYLDRANFGFGVAGGMAGDLRISAAATSLLGAVFFLGYFIFQIPGALYASRNSAKKLIFWSLLCWGILAAATGLVPDIHLLIGIRFLLGVVESAVLPSMLILLSRWFTKGERARANTFLIFGNPVTILWMSVLSGYLLNALGWRGMFIWEGIPAVCWAFVWWKLMDDRPENASWLDKEELKSLQSAFQEEQTGIRPVKNYGTAFKSPLVILLCLIYMLWSIGVYGFVIWLPSIIHAAPGNGLIKTGWLAALPYLFAAIGMAVVSYGSDKTGVRKSWVWPCLLFSAGAFYCSYLFGMGHFWPSFILLCISGMAMYAPYGPFFAMISELLPANVSGVSIALINGFGALGSFGGVYLVGYLNGTAGGVGSSFLFMAASLLASSVCLFFLPLPDKKN